MKLMHQVAPYPHELADLVKHCKYRRHEGWYIHLEDEQNRDRDNTGKYVGKGMTLVVLTRGYDTYDHSNADYRVYHYFIVPAATYNRASWQRWLFDCLSSVEMHEAMENFVIEYPELCKHCGQGPESDGDHSCPCLMRDEECTAHTHPWQVRPYQPTHGPGDNPYVVHEYADVNQAATRFNDFTNAIQT